MSDILSSSMDPELWLTRTVDLTEDEGVHKYEMPSTSVPQFSHRGRKICRGIIGRNSDLQSLSDFCCLTSMAYPTVNQYFCPLLDLYYLPIQLNPGLSWSFFGWTFCKVYALMSLVLKCQRKLTT